MGRKTVKLSVVRPAGLTGVDGAKGARRATEAEATPVSGADGVALVPGQRWTAPRKAAVVVRLLRGEPLDAISREIGVPVCDLEEWRRKALEGMEEALKTRESRDSDAGELAKAHKRIGELMMDLEVLEERVARNRPFAGKRWRR